ncbi:MAG TPA: hypothetical protein VIU61_31005, partial [Kofleriaceae bacterium]
MSSHTRPGDPQLSRFMREHVNVPFSYAVLETASANRPVRVHKAALVLTMAARSLGEWKNPPVHSEDGRAVFFEYARDLARRATLLEHTARTHDTAQTMQTLVEIQAVCASC